MMASNPSKRPTRTSRRRTFPAGAAVGIAGCTTDGEEGAVLGDGTVELVESMGDTLVVHGSVGDDELQLVSYDPHRSIEHGETLGVTSDPDRLQVFDPDSGQAVYHSSHAETRSETSNRRSVASADS